MRERNYFHSCVSGLDALYYLGVAGLKKGKGLEFNNIK